MKKTHILKSVFISLLAILTVVSGIAFPTSTVLGANEYQITYELNGGTFDGDAITSYFSDQTTLLPENLTKDGNVFMGWYEDEALTSSPVVAVPKGTTGNKKLYAKWGTETIISTAEDFCIAVFISNVGGDTGNTYFRLANDIDLTESDYSQLGTIDKPFLGVFDGDGHTIKGHRLERTDDSIGLIGHLKGGIVKNVFLESNHTVGGSDVGAIVGYNDGGVVYNCGANGAVASTSNTTPVRIMSFNVRVPHDASPNSLEDRAPRIGGVIADYSPDILGIQEATTAWDPYFETILSGYSREFKFRDSLATEYAPLYWKTDKFECLEQNTFWLSETPEAMSLGWDGEYNRTCSYAVLKEKSTGKIIIAANTHLDNKGTEARKKGLKLVRDMLSYLELGYFLQGYDDVSVCLTGDFNVKPDAAAHKEITGYLSNATHVADTMLSDANSPTFNGFGEKEGRVIDYIYLDDKDMDVLSYKVINEQKYDGYVSDHYPIYADVSLTPKSIGGIVGFNKGTILDCYYNGIVISVFGAGGIAGNNYGSIIGGYAVVALPWCGDESGAIAGINRGTVNNTYYVCESSGSYNEDIGIKTTADYLKSNSASLNIIGVWKVSEEINGGLPVPSVVKVEGVETSDTSEESSESTSEESYEASSEEPSEDPAEKLVFKSTSSYVIKNGVLYNVKEKQSEQEVISNFENAGVYVEGKVGTGGKVNLVSNGEVVDTLTIMMLGDLDGSGNVDSTDYLRVRLALLGEYVLDGIYFEAADTDKDKFLSSTDYLRMKSHFLEIINLYD